MRSFTTTLAATSVAFALACGGGAGGDKKDAKTAKVDKKDDKAKDADKDKDKDEAKDAGGGDVVAAMSAAMKAWSEGKFDETLAAFTDDATWALPGGPPPIQGKDAIKKAWEQNRAAFPDIKVAPTRILLTDTVAFVQGVSNGTHKGDFMGVAATDKPVGSDHMQIVTLANGKITGITLVENMPNTMAQIGAAPEGSPPAVAPPAFPSGAPEVIKGEANKANEDALKAFYANFDFDECLKTACAEDMIHHEVATGETVDKPEDHKKDLAQWKAAFPDLKMNVKTIASAGDWVAAHSVFSGTHKGDLGPIKATNKSVNVDYTEIMRFENGKMKEAWGYMNNGQLMAQLGLAPPPGEKPAEVAQK